MQLIGNWQGARNIAVSLLARCEAAQQKTLRNWSLKAETTIKKHLSSQDLNWQPLKAATLRRKIKEGKSLKILIATWQYYNSITYLIRKDTAFVGILNGSTGDKGVSLVELAKTHEYGSKNIPSRPLWKPSFDEMKNWQTENNKPEIILLNDIRTNR